MPTRIVQMSTATATFPSTNGVDFGDAYRIASYADNSTITDSDIAAVVQGTIGKSPKWQTVLTITTDSTAASFASTGADLVPFDKLRVVVATNNATGAFQAWLTASN